MSPLSRVEEKKMNLASNQEEIDHTNVGHDPSDQQLLYNDLFREYNKHIRPVVHHDEIIIVHFEVALFNVLSLVSGSFCFFSFSSLPLLFLLLPLLLTVNFFLFFLILIKSKAKRKWISQENTQRTKERQMCGVRV